MKIGILPIGHFGSEVLGELRSGLVKVFPDTSCLVAKEVLDVPSQAFDKRRNQFSSSVILNRVLAFSVDWVEFDRVLGVVDVDVFVSGLNYVFGEAFSPGRAALISLWRLRPEFYGEKSDVGVFFGRALKEAVHELGHTLGLQHCQRRSCVMHFSNSVFDTDFKQSLFCSQHYLQAALAISGLG